MADCSVKILRLLTEDLTLFIGCGSLINYNFLLSLLVLLDPPEFHGCDQFPLRMAYRLHRIGLRLPYNTEHLYSVSHLVTIRLRWFCHLFAFTRLLIKAIVRIYTWFTRSSGYVTALAVISTAHSHGEAFSLHLCTMRHVI